MLTLKMLRDDPEFIVNKLKIKNFDARPIVDKVLVFKKIPHKGFQKCNGHRQLLTKVKINEIA